MPQIRYIDWLKKHDDIDKFTLLLISLGFSVTDTAKALSVSRAKVYRSIRHAGLAPQEFNDSTSDMRIDQTQDLKSLRLYGLYLNNARDLEIEPTLKDYLLWLDQEGYIAYDIQNNDTE